MWNRRPVLHLSAVPSIPIDATSSVDVRPAPANHRHTSPIDGWGWDVDGMTGGGNGDEAPPIESDTAEVEAPPNSRSDRWGGGVTAAEMREVRWVRPEVVVQVRFVEWTAEGRLRHAAFVGVRPDKEAREVRRE